MDRRKSVMEFSEHWQGLLRFFLIISLLQFAAVSADFSIFPRTCCVLGRFFFRYSPMRCSQAFLPQAVKGRGSAPARPPLPQTIRPRPPHPLPQPPTFSVFHSQFPHPPPISAPFRRISPQNSYLYFRFRPSACFFPENPV